MSDAKTELREIARIVERACGKGRGFALFLNTRSQTVYASNGDRKDIISTLEEWLERTASKRKPKNESSEEIDTRLSLERRCAEIGHVLARAPGTHVALFLFDFGEGGNLAYFTTNDGMRKGIASWVKSEKNRS